MTLAGPAGRLAVYNSLQRRNRRVAVLRLAVPIVGVVTLAALLGQIYLSSLGGRYTIGSVSVTPDTVLVEAPEYAGTLSDGSYYRISAERARADADATDIVTLDDVFVVLNRADGVQMQVEAATAELDGPRQSVRVPTPIEVADSQGTQGWLGPSLFDWPAQTLTSAGPVAIDYADGTTIRAHGMVYDAGAGLWTFSRVVLTLPYTPGEDGS